LDYVSQLKQNCDIVSVAQALKCLPSRKEGNRYQGDTCPKCHKDESKGSRYFIVYSDTQSFYCHHCGAKSDVIDGKGGVKVRRVAVEKCDTWLMDKRPTC
jgi:Zn finger protein HypA/HybF involved in hydrogenase expression